MAFELTYGGEYSLALHFEPHVEERLLNLIRRDESSEVSDRARASIVSRLVDVISMVVEDNALPPTEKQVKYAVAIARELQLELPAGVLQFRDAAAAFLDTHAEHYRRRKNHGESRSSG